MSIGYRCLYRRQFLTIGCLPQEIGMKVRNIKKRVLWAVAGLLAATVLIIVVCDVMVSYNVDNRVYTRVEEVPAREVGLVLGTSPVSYWTGQRNLYFDARIQAAAELYKAGKIRKVIVSGGDYREQGKYGFDEPASMRDSLIKQGVDSASIILDYDGTRTIKSINNMRLKYHIISFIIISQEYHNERGLFQADRCGLDAIAYNASTPPVKESWIRNRGREALARVKLFIDIYINPG